MQVIGRYRVQGEVGRGGAGAVYRALAPDGTPVAIKLLLAGKDASEVQRRRFQREVQALLRLQHPHVVRILDAGDVEGCPWLALEWVDGETLAARLGREGPLEPLAAAEVVALLARALEHCHERGVLHRDLKPGNVLLRARDGRPALIDFGLTREVRPGDPGSGSSGLQLSVAGRFLGTPGYWAPEQARGDLAAIGTATDVWGLGALLFTLLTASPPMRGESLVELVAALERPAPPPSQLRPGTPPELDAVCARALALDPARRHASAAELAGELEALLVGPTIEAAPEPHGPRRARVRLGLVGGVAAALLAGAAAWTRSTLLAGRDPGSSGVVEPAPPRLAPVPAVPAPPGADQGRALLAEARAAWRADDLDRALERAESLARLEAPGARAAARLVRSLVRLVELDFQASAGEAHQALTGAAEPETRALAEVVLAYCRGESIAAAVRVREARPLLSSDADLAFLAGLVSSALGDVLGAIQELSRAVALDPGHAHAWFRLGLARLGRGESTRASQDLSRVLQLSPRHFGALSSRGRARALGGDAAGAVEDFGRALELEPQAWVFHARGAVRQSLGDPEGALQDLDRAVELDPRNPDALAGRGELHACRGDLERAIRDWSAALQLDPRHIRALIDRGRARLNLGQVVGAAQDLERATALLPAGSPQAAELDLLLEGSRLPAPTRRP